MATRTVMYEPGMERLEDITTRAAHHVCDLIEADVKRDVNVLTGKLKSTVRTERLKKSGRVWIGSDHWYFIEYGVKPHVIRTSHKKALADADGTIFGQRVNHPGHRAYMPMRRNFYKERSLEGFRP